MSVDSGSHIGYRLYTTETNEPRYEQVPTEKPLVLEVFGQKKPVLIFNLTTKLIMDQENENGSGKYFNRRYPAFETPASQWCILYETKPLILMTDPERYKKIWPTNTNPKQQTHILETSRPLFENGPMLLESMQITSTSKARFITYPLRPDPKKCFDTMYTEGFKLLRQSSRDELETRDFAVECRHLVSRDNEGKLQKVRNIEMVFIVYLKSIQIDLKNVIDREEYQRLDSLENVLLFKQTG